MAGGVCSNNVILKLFTIRNTVLRSNLNDPWMTVILNSISVAVLPTVQYYGGSKDEKSGKLEGCVGKKDAGIHHLFYY